MAGGWNTAPRLLPTFRSARYRRRRDWQRSVGACHVRRPRRRRGHAGQPRGARSWFATGADAGADESSVCWACAGARRPSAGLAVRGEVVQHASPSACSHFADHTLDRLAAGTPRSGCCCAMRRSKALPAAAAELACWRTRRDDARIAASLERIPAAAAALAGAIAALALKPCWRRLPSGCGRRRSTTLPEVERGRRGPDGRHSGCAGPGGDHAHPQPNWSAAIAATGWSSSSASAGRMPCRAAATGRSETATCLSEKRATNAPRNAAAGVRTVCCCPAHRQVGLAALPSPRDDELEVALGRTSSSRSPTAKRFLRRSPVRPAA